jgi:hypothetical protein
MKKRMIDLWRRLRLTSPRIKTVEFVDSPTDVPDKIERQTLFVVGSSEFQSGLSSSVHADTRTASRLACSAATDPRGSSASTRTARPSFRPSTRWASGGVTSGSAMGACAGFDGFDVEPRQPDRSNRPASNPFVKRLAGIAAR